MTIAYDNTAGNVHNPSSPPMGGSSAAVLVGREAVAVADADADGNAQAVKAMRARIAQWERATGR